MERSNRSDRGATGRWAPQVPMRDRTAPARGGTVSAAAAGSPAPSPSPRFPAALGRARSGVRLAVLGGFDLWVDAEPVAVPAGSERVLAFVTLCCRAAVPRGLIAGTLWPEAPERCAHANLRSALSRMHSAGRQALDIGPAEVRLVHGATVDLHHARALAHHILAPTTPAPAPGPDLEAVEVLSADLLPGWYDDWALLQAEDWRQLRLHALERLAEALTAARRFAAAVAAAHAAVRADPLRESGQACLIRAHLAEGNPSEALHDFTRYARRLRQELRLEPSACLRQLVADLSPVTPR